MKFKAKKSTADGRLTKDTIYQGGFVSINKFGASYEFDTRIVVFDNFGRWMTFNTQVFRPYL